MVFHHLSQLNHQWSEDITKLSFKFIVNISDRSQKLFLHDKFINNKAQKGAGFDSKRIPITCQHILEPS